MKEKNPLIGTIFEGYRTVIFDLDKTIWDCYKSDGTSIGAYATTAPYELVADNMVMDVNRNIIRLQPGVKKVLDVLDNCDLNMGIVSSGELDDRPFGAQPSTMLLKKFDIYKYFNYDIVLRRGADKSKYVKAFGETLFIDDDQEHLVNVNQAGEADVLRRSAFAKWEDLLSPRNTQLSFREL